MELLTQVEKDFYQISLKGELDASNALLLDEALEKAIACSPGQIWVDCQQLQYISSAGLGVFIYHLPTLSAGNISLVLHQIGPKVLDVFQVMGLDSFFTLMHGHPLESFSGKESRPSNYSVGQ
jgi:anti-sigma B factor antagonist